MKYNYKKIGKRIADERRNTCKLSQDNFLNMLSTNYGIGMSRNTLSAIENGKYENYDFYFLSSLCEIFNCEIGYLLCEYDFKTGRNTDIGKETGLSDKAIDNLIAIQKNTSGPYPPNPLQKNVITAIDMLLRYDYKILQNIGRYFNTPETDKNVLIQLSNTTQSFKESELAEAELLKLIYGKLTEFKKHIVNNDFPDYIVNELEHKKVSLEDIF